MVQKGHGDQAELVLITHPTVEKGFFAAIAEVQALSRLQGCAHDHPRARALTP